MKDENIDFSTAYLQGFHDGKTKSEAKLNKAINFLEKDLWFKISLDNEDEVVVKQSDLKKLLQILKKI